MAFASRYFAVNLCTCTDSCYTAPMTKAHSSAAATLRIGIDCRMFSSAFTGIGRYTFELVTRFIEFNDAQENPNQLILFFNNPEFKSFTTTSPNVKKILVNARHYSLREQTTFAYKLYRENLDLVHFPHFNVPILYRRSYVLTIHDLILSLFPGKKMNKWYHRLAYNLTIKNATRKAKKIIAVSQSTKNDLVNLMKISAQKITVIYNGLSPIFTLLSTEKELAPMMKTLAKYHVQKPFLLYTGVWRNHKNLPNLLRAFHLLRTAHELNFNLVITGRPDPHYPEVKDTIAKYDLAAHVMLPGLVSEEELVNLYNAASIYVFPSLYEGFGLPPLESMACGTPVAASRASCIPEVCGLDNALFFNPEDPTDIAKQVAAIYKDSGLMAELTEKGVARAKKFSWDTSAQETWKLMFTNSRAPRIFPSNKP